VFHGPQGFRDRCLLRVPPDNAIVALTLQKHATFEPLNERDLLLRRTISVYQALGDYSTTFRLPDSAKSSITLCFDNVVVKPGSRFVIKRLGVPPTGDLIVVFDVSFPDTVAQVEPEVLAALRDAAPKTATNKQKNIKQIVVRDQDRVSQ
jgi:DnaJ-class molecular chaperone